MTAANAPTTPVTPAMARALIQRAREKGYDRGVLAFSARPDATSPAAFTEGRQEVRIVPAVSALAIREAIRDANPDGWLVIVTDRPAEDLGPGLLGHFVWARLRHPDPWDALKQRFSAHSVDTRLLGIHRAREVATGLLELSPAAEWPPAPAGVLTADHALAAAARQELGLPDGPIDLIAVLQWSTDPNLPGRMARLRSATGEATADAILGWVADSAGEARQLVAALLRSGTPTDIVPLGVVLDSLLTASARQEAAVALARLQHRWGSVPHEALAAAGRLSTVVVTGMLTGTTTVDEARRLLSRGDDLMAEAEGGALAAGSSLLRSGLTHRLRALADVLRHEAPDPAALETAWAAVAAHRLSDIDERVAAARAGVRLVRWLRTEGTEEAPTSLDELAQRHLTQDAWVDSAVNDAEAGADEHFLATALESVLTRVQARRGEHDRQFAAELARAEGQPGDGAIPLERVLPDIVFPLAEKHPALLLVLDGLSTGVATEVLADITTRMDYTFTEYLLPGRSRRTPGITVLPSLTEASRASLLSGTLVRGQQDAERRNFTELVRARGLGATKLLHKKGLDTTRQGFALADDLRLAIEDVDQYRLVGCVLNTIDDALDRTDPGGTDWSTETVKHLAPLLRAARMAGRLVILTSDHGHIVERRRGEQRGAGLSGRHRSVTGEIGADEVVVRGPRVLAEGNEAILAVSERLRYGPLKAGYHGGAAPAEVVVPVAVLAPTSLEHDLTPAAPPEPEWWEGHVPVASSAPPVARPVPTKIAASAQPDLFNDVPEPTRGTSTTGADLLSSATYKAQRKLVGRLAVTDEAVQQLIDALALAPDHRLPAARAAGTLGVTTNRVPMMVSQVAKLLNVEGYPVVSSDPATQTVVLDPALLAEQYGMRLA